MEKYRTAVNRAFIRFDTGNLVEVRQVKAL